MSGRLTREFLERRLHPVLATAAVALGIGATATYQFNHSSVAKPAVKLTGIQNDADQKQPFHPAPGHESLQKFKIAENVTEDAKSEQAPEIAHDSAGKDEAVNQHDFTPVAEGLGVFHSPEDDSKPAPDTIYTLEEVSKHISEGDIWVTYQGSVYDVSEFVPSHPGGSKILLAAGKSLEPFWSMYRVHKTDETRAILEEYRIGSLSPEDCKDIPDMSNPYSLEPDRSDKKLVVRSQEPFNAETPLKVLCESDITPMENFFVRNHLPVPNIQPELYELKISGEGVSERVFNLGQLKAFPKYSVRATIQCAGNARSAMDAVKAVRGLQWGSGAISTAEWSGARLTDVLEACNYQPTEAGRHAVFEGLDRDMTQAYGSSIPIEKATDPRGDVLLAYEMNGRDIPRDNGYPVRVIVPGVVGARNVKWLSSITIDESESQSHWQQKDYKGFSPSSDWDHLNWSKSKAIQDLPVISAICSPEKGESVSSGSVAKVKGYAYSGGGKEIIRVDVSADGGKTWVVADLSEDKAPEGRHWAFRRWNADIPIPENMKGKSVELVCKAVDRSYNGQPESFESIYNARGVLCNAWHRVEVQCQ